MRTLPMTVLLHDAPCARAYLVAMRRAGVRPARILLVVVSRHPTRKTRLAPWLPRPLRTAFAERYHEAANHYWPRRIRRDHPELIRIIGAGLRTLFPDAPAMLDEMAGRFPYAAYCDTLERLVVDDLRDPTLADRLRREPPPATVLFTGGGILPAALVEMPGVRFLHVHPGHLPEVRGADGLLWSVLVRGRPGVSCFEMARAIDTGDVLVARDAPTLRFPVPARDRPDDQTLYRALFAFVDPLLRAHLLVAHVVTTDATPAAPVGTPQRSDDGVTYYFLEPPLLHRALALVFPPDAPAADVAPG